MGIPKKNIRFYEAEGLLTPRRNSQNGYRDYGEEEVETLRRIKLMRKLGVPLEEIRQMLSGSHTVADGMRRHLVTLERERKNLEESIALCHRLKEREEPLCALNAQALLEEMASMEHQGATFLNRQIRDARRGRYIAPWAVTVIMVALMGGLIALMLWGFSVDADQAPPLPLVIALVAIPAVVILGVVLALVQRLQEIEKGEIDDAQKY